MFKREKNRVKYSREKQRERGCLPYLAMSWPEMEELTKSLGNEEKKRALQYPGKWIMPKLMHRTAQWLHVGRHVDTQPSSSLSHPVCDALYPCLENPSIARFPKLFWTVELAASCNSPLCPAHGAVVFPHWFKQVVKKKQKLWILTSSQ